MSSNTGTDPKVIMGLGAAAFLVGAFIMYMVKLYYAKKAADEEAAKGESGWAGGPAAAPAPSPPGPVSDVLTAKDALLRTAKPLQVSEIDINVVSPPAITAPFTINSNTPPEYTIVFDLKVEKFVTNGGVFTILDRGGGGGAADSNRPVVTLRSTDKYVIQFEHKPSVTASSSTGPVAAEDFKNCAIIVKAASDATASVKIYWDGAKVAEAEAAAADWGDVSSAWRWAGGQTAVNAGAGYIKIKNAYIFPKAIEETDVATLNSRAASATTSTYTAEPLVASWKFNPGGYESD